ERRPEIAGERGFEEQPRAREGMDHLDAHKVQERPIEAVLLLEVAVRRQMAVTLVAQDRMADGGEMPARLVGSPAVRNDAQDGMARGARQSAIARAGRVGSTCFAQLAGDCALRRRYAFRGGEVDEPAALRQGFGP